MASVLAFQPDADDPDAGNALLTSVRCELSVIRARARVAPPLTATAAKFAEHMLAYEEWDHKQPARRDFIDRFPTPIGILLQSHCFLIQKNLRMD